MQDCKAIPNDPDIVKTGSFVERAMYGGNADVRRAIKQGMDVTEVDEDGMNALHWATNLGKQPMVKLLLQEAIDVDAQDGFGNTALHYAVLSSNTSIQLLIDAGASTEIENHQHRTPLMIACKIGKVGAVKNLCSAGANARVDANAAHSLIWHAMSSASSMSPSNINTMVRTLLKAGATVGTVDIKSGNTELHRAAKAVRNDYELKLRSDLMKILINAGVSPWQRNDAGESALAIMDASALPLLKPALKKYIKGKELEIAASIREVVELKAFYFNQSRLSRQEIFELLPEGAPAKHEFEEAIALPPIEVDG